MGRVRISLRLEGAHCEAVDLLRPADTMSDIVATLLYPVTDRPYRELYELVSGVERGAAAGSDRCRAPLAHQSRRIVTGVPRRALRVSTS